MDTTDTPDGGTMDAVAALARPVTRPTSNGEPDDFADRVAAARDRIARASIPENATIPRPEAIVELTDALNPVNRYLHSGNASDRSVKHRRHLLERVRRMLIESGMDNQWRNVPLPQFPWHCVDEAVATTFADLVADRYRNHHTRGNAVSTLRSILRHCATVGLITSGQGGKLLECLPSPSAPSQRAGRCIEADVLTSLLRAALDQGGPTGLSDAAMIAILASTGVRISELAQITIAAVDLQKRSITIKRTKGGRRHVVWLHPSAAEQVRSWIDVRGDVDGALFFSGRHPGQPLHISSIRARLQRVQQLAGITVMYSSHDFRRTLITQLLRSGTDPFVVARLVGHKDVSTTLLYDRRTEAEDRAAIDGLDFGALTLGGAQ